MISPGESASTLLGIPDWVVAWSGLLIASGSLVWQIVSWRISGARVRVETQILVRGRDRAVPKEEVAIVARNRGRTAINIDAVGVVPVRGEGLILLRTDSDVVRLDPGASHSWVADLRDLAEDLLESGYDPAGEFRAGVWLATGKLKRSRKRHNLEPFVYRVHFVVSSKEGGATLSVDHPGAGQSLLVPVYPYSAVEAVAPRLEPAFAHYVKQWKRIALPNPESTDALCFYLNPSEVPDRIADPAVAEELADLALPSYRDEDLEWFEGRKPTVLWTNKDKKWSTSLRIRSNRDDFCFHAFDKEVAPFGGIAAYQARRSHPQVL